MKTDLLCMVILHREIKTVLCSQPGNESVLSVMLLTSWQNVCRNQLAVALVVRILAGPACPSQFKNESGSILQTYLEISIYEICTRCFHSYPPNMLDCIIFSSGGREKNLTSLSLLLITDFDFCTSWVRTFFCNCFSLFLLKSLQPLLFSRTRNLAHSLFETVIPSGEPMD